MIVLVLAASRPAFLNWCREEGINPRDPSVKYVRDFQDLRGLGQRVKLVVDESFYIEDGRNLSRFFLLEDARAVEVRNNQYYSEEPEPDRP